MSLLLCISAFSYLLSGVQIDLSQYAMDIIKPIGGKEGFYTAYTSCSIREPEYIQ